MTNITYTVSFQAGKLGLTLKSIPQISSNDDIYRFIPTFCIVMAVSDSTPASANVKVGDLILSVNNTNFIREEFNHNDIIGPLPPPSPPSLTSRSSNSPPTNDHVERETNPVTSNSKETGVAVDDGSGRSEESGKSDESGRSDDFVHVKCGSSGEVKVRPPSARKLPNDITFTPTISI